MNNEFEVCGLSDEDFEVIEGVSKYGSIVVTEEKLISSMPKPKEFIKCNETLVDKLKSMVNLTSDGPNGQKLMGDIFATGTIPVNNVVFEYDPVELEQHVPMNIQIFTSDDPEGIISGFKTNDTEFVTVGVMRMTIIGTNLNCDIAIRINRNFVVDWMPIFRVGSEDKRLGSFKKNETILNMIIAVKEKIFLAWYGLQLALLNPVIKERIHRETVPMDEVKAGNRKKKAKNVKRYVKRITVDDLSDIEIADPKHHNMTKSYWWVTGHWRNQKTKDGHIRKFIKGYWKGPMREIADELGYEPYERKVIL